MRLILCILSLVFASASSGHDEDRVFDLINKANEMVNTDTDEALNIIEEALRLSIRTKNLRAEAYCYNTIGAINYKLSAYDESIRYYQKSLRLFASVDDPKGTYNSTKYIGLAYEANKNTRKARDYYLIFLNLAESGNNTSDLLDVLYSLGRVTYNIGEYSTAQKYFVRAKSLEEASGNQDGIATAQNWLGLVEEKLGNNEKAENLYLNSNQTAIKNSNIAEANKSYDNLSNYYQKSKRKEEYIEVQQKALDYNVRSGDPKKASRNALNIAEANLETNNPTEAIPYIKTSINISQDLGNLEDLSVSNLLLSKAYEQQGNYDAALQEYKKYMELVDSLNNTRAKEESIALEMSHDLSSKVSEIRELEKELMAERETSQNLDESLSESRRKQHEQEQKRANDRIIMLALAGVLLIALVSSYLIYRSSKEKRIANQLLALKSLRSQMNPHFIFNSLNSVNSFIASNDEKSANKYLSEFSRLMRAVMENSKHDFVSLASELSILKLYLDLEHLRFSDKFDYSFEVDLELDPETVEIPPMLIQPYIENAIWHGLRYREEIGYLKVFFRESAGVLMVTIEDNGIGRKRSQELKTVNQKANKSTGMKNIEGRLQLLNELHRMNLGVSVSDVDPEGLFTGTRVEISIPYNKNQEAA